ncbi:MAG: chemotaxis protein CheX [Candidatus Sulfomarinibacteraceae bacterium]
MKPDENQIRSIVRDVWSTQLGLTIDDLAERPTFENTKTLTAAIHITGDFRGCVRLECSRALILRSASIMFGQPETELVRDDEIDVIGELTNVVTGNIKALVAGENSLSLPTIIDGSDYEVFTLDVKTMDDYWFALDGEAMIVTVVEHGGG